MDTIGQSNIRRRLSSLRTAIRIRLFIEGLAWLIIAVSAAVVVSLSFDWSMRLDRPQRIVISVALLMGVLYVIWRQIFTPLRFPMDIPNLAMLVERKFTSLGDRLISAIQLAGGVAGGGNVSAAMIEKVVDQACQMVRPLSFKKIIEGKKLLKIAAIAVVSAGLIVSFGVFRPQLFGLWYARNVLFASCPWPQDTYLTVKGGPDFRVVRGDDLKVEIVIEPESLVKPSQITLYARFPSVAGWTEEVLDQADVGGQAGFVKVFTDVHEPFEFYVVGGDDNRDKTKSHKITLIDPPSLTQLVFRVKSPGYMNRPSMDIDGGAGVLQLPPGAEVEVMGTTNKDLSAGELQINDEKVFDLKIASDSPRQVRGRFQTPKSNKNVRQNLKFVLTDSDGNVNRKGQQYIIQLQPDLPPMVELKRRGAGLLGVLVSARADLPLGITARDEFGVGGVQLMLAVRRQSGENGGTSGESTFVPVDDVLKVPPGVDNHEMIREHYLDLEKLKLDLKPKDIIEIRADVSDLLPEDFGGPNKSSSATMTLQVATDQELTDILVVKQKEVRQSFSQAMEVQNTAYGKILAAAQNLMSASSVDVDVASKVSESSGLQQGLSAELSKAAVMLQGVHSEMKCNRLGSAAGLANLQVIINDISSLIPGNDSLSAQLAASEKTTDVKSLSTSVDDIAGRQKDQLGKMSDILKKMQEWESRMEMLRLVEIMIHDAKLLEENIANREKEKGAGILKTSPSGGSPLKKSPEPLKPTENSSPASRPTTSPK